MHEHEEMRDNYIFFFGLKWKEILYFMQLCTNTTSFSNEFSKSNKTTQVHETFGV
jgi:hypothetical protein